MANNPKRELMTDAKRELVESARAKLEAKINRLNEAGWHNQFDYANYGVQYNPVYDKKTGRVKSFEESGLKTVKQYTHLTNMMGSAPELTDKWNLERARLIGSEVFDTMAKQDMFRMSEDVREKFIEKYVEAVKKYHQDDEDFNYEVIKSIYESIGGHNVEGLQSGDYGEESGE